MPKTLKIQDLEITIKSNNDNDYISLTDMAKWKNVEEPRLVIQKWMTTKFTIQFLGVWEEIHNEDNFNRTEFEAFRNEAGSNIFSMSPDKWTKATKAIGIKSSAGRYGGTFAHKDIALEFASWLSPEFKLYIIKEFQRLKEQEKTTTHSLEWQIKRSLTKTNYRIHTDSIKNQLENLNLTQFQENLVYADEADMLNLIMFGMIAKDWKTKNPTLAKQGLNIRDEAQIEELIVLSGLETLNAYLINQGENKKFRMQKLVIEAKKNFESIQRQHSVKEIKKLSTGLNFEK